VVLEDQQLHLDNLGDQVVREGQEVREDQQRHQVSLVDLGVHSDQVVQVVPAVQEGLQPHQVSLAVQEVLMDQVVLVVQVVQGERAVEVTALDFLVIKLLL